MEYIFQSPQQRIVYMQLIATPHIVLTELSRATGIHRPTLRKIVADLTVLGLIKKSRLGKRDVFSTTGIEAFQAFTNGVSHTIDDEIQKIIKTISKERVVSFLQSKQDIKNMYIDLVTTLNKDDSYYCLSSKTSTYDWNEYLSVEFRKVRQKKNLTSYLVSTNPPDGGMRFSLEIKNVFWPTLEKECMILVYGNKVAMVNFKDEKGVVIEDALFASFQRGVIKKMFEVLS